VDPRDVVAAPLVVLVVLVVVVVAGGSEAASVEALDARRSPIRSHGRAPFRVRSITSRKRAAIPTRLRRPAMSVKTDPDHIDVERRHLDLTCPRCAAATVRYWPDYDEPGDVLFCSGCRHLYELTDRWPGTIAPFEPLADDPAQPPARRS
jgi:hypothetical protein